MVQRFEKLSAPIQVNGTEIKNRIAVPPMADFGMTGADGLANQRHVSHYGSFARGGAGLIITEACAVSRMKEPRNTIGLFDDGCIPGMSRIAEAAKQDGAVALVQLMNTGLSIMEEREIARISRGKFLAYKQDFLDAAIRCKKAGFHGVELHAAHGFYLNQILESSTRADEYGGSFENRTRILRELIIEIKDACGKEFLVSVRFGNRNLRELLKTAEAIEKAGGDLLDVSNGSARYRDVPADFPYDGRIYGASLVKKAAGIPVICVGNIVSGEQAEQILESGYADLTAVGRGHLCDPCWAKKVFTGEKPNPCRNCRTCLWYIDGRKCPKSCDAIF